MHKIGKQREKKQKKQKQKGQKIKNKKGFRKADKTWIMGIF